jgi:branched-chain amino acid transport system ATP-binding protein
MLAIARGLINDPLLLLLDEPSLGLAPMIVKQMFGVVAGIKDRGISVFIVEQNVRHSLETSDRAYVLQNGRIVMSDSASELLENTQIKKAYLGL